MAAPKIFISYSHQDERWKDRLLIHLAVLERQGVADVLDVNTLQAGSDWAKQIEKSIHQSDIAVLLVSPSFLASDFVVSKELPALLERRHKEGLPIVPILVRPSMWSAVPTFAELQFANDPSKPLSLASAEEIDEEFASIAQQIADLVEAISERSAVRSVVRPPSARPSRKKAQPRPPVTAMEGCLFVSHSKEDGDFAELLKLRLEREGYEAWVDVDRLDPGLDWRAEIDEAIKSARAVLAIMSPAARASEYVTYEWAFAWGCGTKIIPIMLRQTTLHPRLATLQYLDFTNRIARPWRRLLEVLSKFNDQGNRKSSNRME
jgi:TIR domain